MAGKNVSKPTHFVTSGTLNRNSINQSMYICCVRQYGDLRATYFRFLPFSHYMCVCVKLGDRTSLRLSVDSTMKVSAVRPPQYRRKVGHCRRLFSTKCTVYVWSLTVLSHHVTALKVTHNGGKIMSTYSMNLVTHQQRCPDCLPCENP